MLYLPKPRMEERQMLYSLEGMWKADLGDGCRYDMKLPGTLETEHHKKAGEEGGQGVLCLGTDGVLRHKGISFLFQRFLTIVGGMTEKADYLIRGDG